MVTPPTFFFYKLLSIAYLYFFGSTLKRAAVKGDAKAAEGVLNFFGEKRTYSEGGSLRCFYWIPACMIDVRNCAWLYCRYKGEGSKSGQGVNQSKEVGGERYFFCVFSFGQKTLKTMTQTDSRGDSAESGFGSGGGDAASERKLFGKMPFVSCVSIKMYIKCQAGS